MNVIEFLKNLDGEKTIKIIIALGIIAALDILSPLFSYIIIKIFKRKESKKQIRKSTFYISLKSFFKILGIYISLIYLRPILNYNDNTMNWINKLFKIVVIITTSRGIAQGINKDSTIIKKFKEKSEKDLDSTTLIFAIRIIRAVIYIVAGFMIAADLGYDLSGIATGLGLGSVVVTLMAQDMIKNLFGGLIIFLDRPFKVGDYIKFSEYEGTVEDITFRSTKVRTLENSIAEIPNSEISSSTVINFSKMQKRRYTIDLPIILNTSLEKMMILEQKISNYLENNDDIIKDSVNVVFKEVRSSDFCIYAYCYINVVDYKEFLKKQEEINYSIINILKEIGVELAYDTKTIELKKV